MALDIALENARIVDGTGAPWFGGAVGIDDGTVATVVRGDGAPAAAETVDLDGLALAPGFIDTHSHSGLRLFEEPTLPPKIRQGITTEIVGQDGFSMAPIYRDGGGAEWEDHLSGLDGRTDRDWTWERTADYFDAIEAAGVAPNVAMLVGHGTVRFNVLGLADRTPDADELDAMADLVTEALDEGAIGFSTGLVYAPQVNADTAEVRALAARLRPYGRPFVAHIRSESDRIWAALDEFVDIGAAEGIPLHLSHFKLVDPPQQGKADRLLGAFETARERGVDLTADQYPYTAGSTMLASHLPAWARSGGAGRTLERLGDPDARARIREELAAGREDWERVVVSSVRSEGNADLEGLSIAEIAARRGDEPETAVLDLLAEERLEVSRIRHMLDEDDVRAILRHERTAVATDGLLVGTPHPRSYGTYPRVLGRYARDENLFSLEEAVRMMTSLPARAMGLQRKGLVRPGMDADLVAFDPAVVASPATYEEPEQFPEGMPHVLVNGTFVVRDGAVTGATPGTAIRKGVD